VLDNSHYVNETLVSTNAPTVQPIFALVNRSSTSNSPVQSFAPRTRGQLMDEDFGDVGYGDICASDAQITICGTVGRRSRAAGFSHVVRYGP
jgi:hypothetical protein